jgi:hypothetical protein
MISRHFRLLVGASAASVAACLACFNPSLEAQANRRARTSRGLAAGAKVAQSAKGSEALQEAWHMLDEDATTGWVSEPGAHLQPTVIELADRRVIHSVQFDTAQIETEGREPKEVLVEISDTSATAGFKPLVRASLSAARRMASGSTWRAIFQAAGCASA